MSQPSEMTSRELARATIDMFSAGASCIAAGFTFAAAFVRPSLIAVARGMLSGAATIIENSGQAEPEEDGDEDEPDTVPTVPLEAMN